MQIKEQTRLILPILTVSALLLLVGGLMAWYLQHSQREASQLLSSSITRVQAAEELQRIGEEMQKSVDQYLMTGDAKSLVSQSMLKNEANQWLRSIDELIESDKDRVLIEQLKSGYREFIAELERFAVQSPSPQTALAAVSALNRTFQQQVYAPAREYQRFNRDRLVNLTERAQIETNRMGASLLLIGVCGALGGLLAGFAVARNVQRRLLVNERAMAHSEQLATLGRVAAALAHELRNPLTSLRLITQSTRAEAQQASSAEITLDAADFAILEQEIERMDRSIQSFLDYARPPHPEKRTCVAQTLIRQTVSLVQRRASQIGVEFHDELPLDPIQFQADPNQIRQVLLNILINALDASPNGGTVALRARVAASPGNHSRKVGHQGMGRREVRQIGDGSLDDRSVVEIKIVDSGIGLPHEQGDQIFEAFFSTKETGTGLGLAICKRIVEDHGGELEAYNAASAGTALVVRLPKTQPLATEDSSSVESLIGN